MKLIYKPFGIALGILAGFISKKIFDQVWGLIDDYEPPKPTQKEASWTKVIAAAAVEGVAFSVTRAAVDRAGARSFEHVTGVWPGDRAPEPE
jgi:uncharacterized protein DUF4235